MTVDQDQADDVARTVTGVAQDAPTFMALGVALKLEEKRWTGPLPPLAQPVVKLPG